MPANPNGSNLASPVPGVTDPNPYAPTVWGNRYVDLTVPSGQLCLVQRLELSSLIEGDAVDDYNVLVSLVETEHVSKKSRGSGKAPGKSKQASKHADAILGDRDHLKKVLRLTDIIVQKVVVQPPIHPIPRDEEGNELPRVEGVVYIDSVADTDKAFLVQWAFGGTRDLERFRQELNETVDGMAHVKDLSLPSQ